MIRKKPSYTPWHQGLLRARAINSGYRLRRNKDGLWSILDDETERVSEFGDLLTLDEVAEIVLFKMRD